MEGATIFTEHVRALAPDAPPPAADHFAALWQALRAVLVSELRKRSLWNVPPAYLGVYGGGSWSQDETLEELLVECYAAAFLSRLRSLRAQLQVRSSIDGLIFLNVRNFLHDVQKKHDPLGFRVFTVLRAAVRDLVRDGVVRVLAGDPEIRNDTVLGFTAGDAEEPAGTDRARAINDALMPDLVTAQGKAQVKLIARLAALLAGWRDEGPAAFRFQDLCEALKNDARRRWAAIWEQEEGPTAREDRDGELAGLVGQVQPDTGFEERESFGKLLACVEAALDAGGEDETTRDYLRRLWLFLRSHSADGGDALPSRRKIAALLGIPRDRLGELHATLGRLVDVCRGHSGNVAVKEDRRGTGGG